MSLMLRLLVLLAAVVLPACAPTGSAGGARTLREAISYEPRSLDPLLAQSISDNEILRLMYDPLIACDRAGRPVPALAAVVPTRANGGISADGLTITYHLRRGVRWHDGAPFTAEDVRFSWRAVMNPRNNVFGRQGYDEVASIDAPDRNTAIVHLKRRYPPFVSQFFTDLQEDAKALVPAHLL
ncbi:MAG: peptide ABC transporter substrate-binding protein, partial [Candidatus Eremiobacteraeota bacterium]|nr:peptide ABC transporter substrate-binding protein [Candidatus Eremiobacteraeota bacterium]